jgi:hypothetical protein
MTHLLLLFLSDKVSVHKVSSKKGKRKNEEGKKKSEERCGWRGSA